MLKTETSRARTIFDEGDLWRDRVTRKALPIVLWCAKHGSTITYGQLARELEYYGEEQQTFTVQYRMPAGKIGTLMQELSAEWGELVPPVNAIIVNKETKLPGNGCDEFIAEFERSSRRVRLTDRNRQALVQDTIERVFAYRKWDAVAAHFGINLPESVAVLTQTEPSPILLPDAAPIHGNGGEGEAHRRLKEWVAGQPGLFEDYGDFKKGQVEAPLLSGDGVDVLFSSGVACLAVEVKADNALDSDLLRGIFQCIKYRAVLRAMQQAESKSRVVQAVLVVERPLSADLARLAKRLEVDWFVVHSV